MTDSLDKWRARLGHLIFENTIADLAYISKDASSEPSIMAVKRCTGGPTNVLLCWFSLKRREGTLR